MDPATLAALIALGANALNGIIDFAKAHGATPEQLEELRNRVHAEAAASDARYDAAVAGAKARQG